MSLVVTAQTKCTIFLVSISYTIKHMDGDMDMEMICRWGYA